MLNLCQVLILRKWYNHIDKRLRAEHRSVTNQQEVKFMDILDDLIEKFAISLDSTLMSNPEYNKISLQLKELFENKLSAEQASELDLIIGMLSSAIFYSATKAGMRLGAKITAGLLK